MSMHLLQHHRSNPLLHRGGGSAAGLFSHPGLAAEHMDQGTSRYGVGGEDLTDESASLVDAGWSSGEEVKTFQGRSHNEV